MTDPKLQMARRIAEKYADSAQECLFGHTVSQTVRRVLEDGLAQAALAAIEECTEAQSARIEELEAALRPFAELAETVDKGRWLDEAGFTLMHHHAYAGCVKLCDLRRARATLSNIGGSNDG